MTREEFLDWAATQDQRYEFNPTSGRTDRTEKLREYQAVPSIRRYVILEHTSVGLTVHFRLSGEDAWTATALTSGDILLMPEIGIGIPIVEFYEDTDLSELTSANAGAMDGNNETTR
jgi:hypothetical protein